MRKSTSVLQAITFGFAAALFGGCVGSGTTHASVGVSATVDTPTMVLIAPGVYVVENHPSAIFYSDGYYWRYDDGVWLRSSYYNSGFVVVRRTVLPRSIVRIERPRRYVRYRGSANARRRAARRAKQREKADKRRDKRRERVEKRRDKRRDRVEKRRDKRHERAEKRRHKRHDHKRHDRRNN